MHCPHCGRIIEPGARFCVRCGGMLSPPPAETPTKPEKVIVLPRSPLFIGGLVLSMALLFLCGCLVGAGGGVTVMAYLSPTQTPVPTATAPPTPTAMPTPVSMPTRTPLPPATRSAFIEPMQRYSSASQGFSMHYPMGWNLQEDRSGVIFSSPDGVALVVITVVQNPVGSEKAFRDQSVQNFARSLTDMKVVTEDTRTFNEVTWQYLILTGVLQNNAPVTIDHYTVIHPNGRGYIFSGITLTDNYETASQTFTQMMESFQVLP